MSLSSISLFLDIRKMSDIFLAQDDFHSALSVKVRLIMDTTQVHVGCNGDRW